MPKGAWGKVLMKGGIEEEWAIMGRGGPRRGNGAILFHGQGDRKTGQDWEVPDLGYRIQFGVELADGRRPEIGEKYRVTAAQQCA